MPKLTEQEFTQLVKSMPNASEEEILAAAEEQERRSYGLQPRRNDPTIWEQLNTPLFDVPEFQHEEDDSVFTRWAKKAGNFGSAVLEGMSSPMGLASLAVPTSAAFAGMRGITRLGRFGLGRAARNAEVALSAPYIATGAYNAAEGALEGDPAKATAGVIEAGLGAVGVGGAMKGYARRKGASDKLVTMLRENEPHGVVSATNPAGRAYDPATNRALQEQLERELREEGLDPLTQEGVFGVRESSFLVPKMTPAQARAAGLRWNQQSVITDEGYRRLADDATFPRTGIEFDQAATDFYSEIRLPDGRLLRYQAKYPDEAFGPPPSAPPVPPSTPRGGPDSGNSKLGASTADPRQSRAGDLEARVAPPSAAKPGDGVTGQAAGKESQLPYVHGSTALAVASPAAAMAIPDDPDSEWDDVLRVGLMGVGAAGLGAAYMKGRSRVTGFPQKDHQRFFENIQERFQAALARRDVTTATNLGARMVNHLQSTGMLNEATMPVVRRMQQQLDRLMQEGSVDPQSLQVGTVSQESAKQLAAKPARAYEEALKPTNAHAVPGGNIGATKSQLLAVAAPSAAMAVPDDPDSELDNYLRATLLGVGAGSIGMAAARQLDLFLPKSVGTLSKALEKAGPGQYRLKPVVVERLRELFKIGQGLPKQANWEGVNKELLRAFDGDVARAKRWAQLWGATSPNTSVPLNTRESVSAHLYSLEKPGSELTVSQAQRLKPVKITMAPSKVPNINLALKDQRLGSPKTDRMGRFLIGEKAIPIDTHTLYAMGSDFDNFGDELAGLRQLMTAAEGLPLRGSLDEEAIYSRVEQALRSALDEIAPGAAMNPTFATMWEGTRAAKGLRHQGGPVDILRQKGLLQAGAMLDPKLLRKVLKSAGWTASAIGLVLKAISTEPKTERLNNAA